MCADDEDLSFSSAIILSFSLEKHIWSRHLAWNAKKLCSKGALLPKYKAYDNLVHSKMLTDTSMILSRKSCLLELFYQRLLEININRDSSFLLFFVLFLFILFVLWNGFDIRLSGIPNKWNTFGKSPMLNHWATNHPKFSISIRKPHLFC